MSTGVLTETGRLQDELLPAVYFDSSVVIDYWMTEEWGKLDIQMSGVPRDYWVPDSLKDSLFQKDPIAQRHEDIVSKRREYIKKLLKSDVRLDKIAKVRDKLISREPKTNAIISPICLLELAEWYAEASFKQISSDETGVMFVQKKGKKDIGGYLGKLIDSMESPEDFMIINSLIQETRLNPSFAVAHGLRGLILVDLINFNLSVSQILLQEPFMYAYVQVGAADILHVLVAQHIGCSYFASFDDDFRRVKKIIKDEAGMTLLSSPEEIFNIL
ncbi:hypothetical protein ACFLTZ_00760 [Chloroflexota bacterium]